MTSRELVRTALILGAIYLMVSACAGAVAGASGAASVMFAADSDFLDALGSLTFTVIGTFLFVASFGLLPGLYVLSSRDVWARRLTSDSLQVPDVSPHLLLGVAAMILGISFGVEGLATFAFGAMVSIGVNALEQTYAASAASGLVYLAAGIWLFRWGRAGVVASA